MALCLEKKKEKKKEERRSSLGNLKIRVAGGSTGAWAVGTAGVSEKGDGSRKAHSCPGQSITERGEVSTELSALLNSIS